MKERGVGALAFLQLQLDICIRLERRPIRLSSQVEVVHFLLNDPRNTFNERMRAETDVLNERDRGKIRQEWNEYTYQTSRQLAAEAVDEAQDDELQLLMRFDDFVHAKFTKRVTEEFTTYQRRIRRLRIWSKMKSAFGLVQ